MITKDINILISAKQEAADIKRESEKFNIASFSDDSIKDAVETFLTGNENYVTVEHRENKISFMGSFYRLGSIVSL